ncbi:MAG: hypothetical protein GY842_05715 [bacterium]|nr:hypothetical protein [bacterium]
MDAKYMRLLVEGDSPERDEEGHELGFLITYDVVAENEDEALAYIRRFEFGVPGSSLIVETCEELEPRPSEPMGVYDYTGHILFPRGEE